VINEWAFHNYWGHVPGLPPKFTPMSRRQGNDLGQYVADPSNCNKLPQSLRDRFPIPSNQFRKHLKTLQFVSEDTDPGPVRI